MKVTALLCDDEPLALVRLRSLLQHLGEVEIVGEALDGFDAIDLARRHQPDLVLLDMEMPGLDGGGVVERLSQLALAHPPLVIFVTAFSRFAVDAFELGAVDFLTKPVRRERLCQAMARVRAALAAREAQRRLADLTANLPRLRDDFADPPERRRVWIRSGPDQIGLLVESIERISAEREYVQIHCNGRAWLHRSSLSAIADELAGSELLRVHRSHMVAPASVAAVQRTGAGEPILVMANGDRVPVSRSYRAALAQIDRSLYRDKERANAKRHP